MSKTPMWIYLADPQQVDGLEDAEDYRIEGEGAHGRKSGQAMVIRFDEAEATAKAYGRLLELCKQAETPELWWVIEEEGGRGTVRMKHCACGWCRAEREDDEVELETFAVATVDYEAV